MKIKFLSIVGTLIIGALALQSLQKSDKNYTDMWKKVTESLQNDLPETAAQQLDEIAAAAKRDKNQPQLLKTILYRKQVLDMQEEDNPQKAFIDFAETQFAELDAVASAVLHVEIARTYADYLDDHHWSIQNNLPIAGDMSQVPMKYWDQQTFRNAIDQHYSAALQNQDALKATNSKDYMVLFDEQNQKDAITYIDYEPSMFEFVFHRTANYYKTIATADDIDENWDTAQWWLADKDFVKVNLGESDEPIIRCLKIFQDLMAYNLENGNEEILLFNDVKRYDFVNNILKEDALYHEKLEALMQQYAENPSVAEICSVYADHLVKSYSETDSTSFGHYAKALELCNASIKKFPKSKGAKQCKDVANFILFDKISINMQATQIPNQPIAAVLTYRNATHPYYKIVKVSEKELLNYQSMREEARFDQLAKSKAVFEKEMDIPAETDYLNHTSLIDLPALPVGQYYLFAMTQKGTTDQKKMLAMSFQVSNLSYIYDEGAEETVLYVVDRKTSVPMANVTVELYDRHYNYKIRKYENKEIADYHTDKNGKVILKQQKNQSFYINLRSGDDVLLSSNYMYMPSARKNDNVHYTTQLFTDRAIYRPGQTVYFKGIVVRQSNKEKTLAEGMNEEIIFQDANWQKISTQKFVTDEYGAFSGSFVIPTGLLNGQFWLDSKYGGMSIRVEEYKRPSFEVNFEQPKEQYKLTQDVTINGSVDAYAGFGLDEAKYTYRVVRKTHFPWRCWWWYYPEVEDEQIAYGEAKTDASGKFAITFNLKPSLKVKPEQQPVFTYEVEVTATSAQGETHSQTYSIRAGYNEVCLSTNLSSMVEKDNLAQCNVEVVNMSGQPASSKVSRKFYRYADASKIDFFVASGNSGMKLDRQLLSDADLDENFPIFDYYAQNKQLKNKVLIYEDVVDVNEKASLFPEKVDFKQGKYFVELKSLDDPLAANVAEFTLFEEKSTAMPYTEPLWVRANKATAHPGETVTFNIGSSLKEVKMWLQITSGDNILVDKWLKINNEIEKIDYKVKESDRGGLQCKVIFVKEGIVQNNSIKVSVPYDNLDLNVELATVRDVLRPGAEEHWEVTVRDKDKQPVAAALLAGMYDESLDVFASNYWWFSMKPNARFAGNFASDGTTAFRSSNSQQQHYYIAALFNFSLPSDWPFFDYLYVGRNLRFSKGNVLYSKSCVVEEECAEISMDEAAPSLSNEAGAGDSETQPSSAEASEPVPTLRENFNETAFFFPNLRTNADGSSTFTFTMPDALTRWKLILMAYTKDNKTGDNTYHFKSSKPVMIMADMPRYIYDNDTIWMVANVINTGEETVTPKAKLEIFDAASMQPIELVLSDAVVQMEELVPGRSKEVRWKVAAQHDLGLLAFRFTAYAGAFSDAEQHLLPVLSSEIFLTQTMPITVKSETKKTFDFDAIANPDSHERDYSLTLNFSTNPVWYAVQALPSLADVPTDRAETAFYVFYANTLSSYIASRIPNLMNYIKTWQITSPDALLSQLEKDQDLKAIMLQETPWVLEAKSESEQRQRISSLFEINTLHQQQSSALALIEKKQTVNGGWSWWDNMPESAYITTYILSGFGKLQSLGAVASLSPTDRNTVQRICDKAVRYLEYAVAENYREMRRLNKEWSIGSSTLKELYALSFFKEQNSDKDFAAAKKYYLNSLDKNWTDFNFNDRAKAAMLLHRTGNTKTAKLMLQSFKECAQKDENIGMYWPKKYFSFESHIATHANIMAAFAEIEDDQEMMDQLRVWLLTQKQTCMWENSASTAEAIYALLMRGSDWLNDDKEVTLSFGNQVIEQNGAVAGTGFIQRRWNANEVTESMRQLTVDNPTKHLVWGGLFRQYFVPIDEVKRDESGFTIRRELFVETVTDAGKLLVPLGQQTLKVGDKLTVKITFENTQDMSHVFVKDLRAAGFEPIEQVSHYEYNDRMSYYQTNTDTDMEFFIEFLPKGVHQVEYSMFVTKEGSLSNGYALIQCLYAPEFSAYSDGLRVEVVGQ